MSEKFSLKWNDYESNWIKSLSGLRNDTESADVTLISDDKVKFSAHKILLSSCSDTFKFILKGNTHTNPLLFLGGVSSVNLGFILDYIYYGEVSLFQKQLDSFLESAQKLEIKGLLGNNQECQEGSEYANESYLKNEYVQEQTQKDEDCRLARMDENSYIKVQSYDFPHLKKLEERWMVTMGSLASLDPAAGMNKRDDAKAGARNWGN